MKPGNILLKPDGAIKVLDFGLAKMGGPASAASAGMSPDNSPTLTLAATQMGVILGTAAYMAPEQAKGKEVDKRADIWAFGVVLYELSTGRRPFHGDDMSDVLASVLKEQPSYEPLPRELRRLVGKCLEKDPAKRLRDIGDAWDLLDDATPVVQQVAIPAKRSVVPWIAAGVMGVAALGAGYVAWQHSTEAAPQVVKLEFSPPAGGWFAVGSGTPAISPDGRKVAFRSQVSGKAMLWVRDLDSLNARMLPGTDNPGAPFWAPDSRQLGFAAGDRLMRIDVTGGPATTITAMPSPSRGGTWNRDGVIVFARSGNGLFRVSAAGGAAVPLLELDASRGEIEQRSPHFLPDGRHFLYTSRYDDASRSAVHVGDLQSNDNREVLQSEIGAVYVAPQEWAGKLGHLLFVRDGTLMAQPFDTDQLKTVGDAVPIAENVDIVSGNYGYFSASQNGALVYTIGGVGSQQQVTWYDHSGKVVGTVGKPMDVEVVRLSHDGKRVAVDRRDAVGSKRDIWLLDLVRGTEQRLTFMADNRFPVWSPDDTRVAFLRSDSSTGKALFKAADGSGGEEELADAGRRPTDWTTEGVVFDTANTTTKTAADLWLRRVPVTSDGAPALLRQTEFGESRGRVSPDGHWLAYVSNESKRNEIVVTSFPSMKGRWQVSVDGGRLPVWSRNGRELFFASVDNSKMMAVDIQPGSQFQAGVPKALFNVRLGPISPDYDVDNQGRFLIATPVDQTAGVPMTVVLNWPALLKK